MIKQISHILRMVCLFIALIFLLFGFILDNTFILVISAIFLLWTIIFDLIIFKMMYLDLELQKIKLLENIFDDLKKENKK